MNTDARGHETILVVEDEPMIRELIETMLKSRGYSVLTVGDPLHAATFSAQHSGPIHLLLGRGHAGHQRPGGCQSNLGAAAGYKSHFHFRLYPERHRASWRFG